MDSLVPIGRKLRKQRHAINSSVPGDAAATFKKTLINDVSESLTALDEQIQRLEENLASEDDGSEEHYHQLSAAVESQKDVIIECNSEGEVTRIVSKIDVEEKIEPLPETLLPAAQCKASLHGGSGRAHKSLVRFRDEHLKSSKKPRHRNPSIPPGNGLLQSKNASGLEKAVHDMLRDYRPAEKKPFYCRCCRFQGEDLSSWELHLKTEMHAVATKLERRMSFCKICRKQFTSPEQLKEHTKGRAHAERLQRVNG